MTSESVEALTGKRLVLGEDDLSATIEAETPATLVLVRPLVRVRLIGMHFDTDKAFLLGSAMRGIRRIVEVYRSDPAGTLLILGHTDTTGRDDYNLDLSIERAEAVKAYLMDDVAAWEAWFAETKPARKRWGSREVSAMIAELPCPPTIAGFQQWSNETRGTELDVDGIAGPKTRRALIEAYMALDGTTLPAGIGVEIHGCGELFPRDDTGDEVEDADNRRVEIYCFHHAVVPPVPGPKATRGEPEHEAWVRQVTQDVDVQIGAEELWIRLHDERSRPLTGVRYRVLVGGKVHAEGTSEDGWVVLFLSDSAALDMVRVVWGSPGDDGALPFQLDLRGAFDAGPERVQAAARLHNLGYLTGTQAQYEQAVQAFQRDHAIGESGLDHGQLPPATRDKLEAIFATDCDATKVPRPAEPQEAEAAPEEAALDADGTGSCFA